MGKTESFGEKMFFSLKESSYHRKRRTKIVLCPEADLFVISMQKRQWLYEFIQTLLSSLLSALLAKISTMK